MSKGIIYNLKVTFLVIYHTAISRIKQTRDICFTSKTYEFTENTSACLRYRRNFDSPVNQFYYALSSPNAVRFIATHLVNGASNRLQTQTCYPPPRPPNTLSSSCDKEHVVRRKRFL